MGRVSRYKKVKACDPFSKQSLVSKQRGSGPSATTVWGFGNDGRKVKKRSLTAQHLQHTKIQRRLARCKGHNKGNPAKYEAFDQSYCGGDEFDINDLIGSLKTVKPMSLDDYQHATSLSNKETTQRSSEVHIPLSASDFAKSAPAAVIGAIRKIDQENCSVESDFDGDEKESLLNPQLTTSALEKSLPHIVDKETQRMAHKVLKKIEDQVAAKSVEATKITPDLSRHDGESKRAYTKRITSETRQIIAKNVLSARNPAKRERRNEFLKNKKNKKQKGKRGSGALSADQLSEDEDAGTYNTTSDSTRILDATRRKPMILADIPRFGDQVDRPPVFRNLPKGANKVKAIQKQGSTMNTAAVNEQSKPPETKVLELTRQKVQAQYSVVKSQRRSAGDFHL